MTRTECEAKIAAHVEAIIDILKEYNPECKYLAVGYLESDERTAFFFNNEYFEGESPDAKLPICFHKRIREE